MFIEATLPSMRSDDVVDVVVNMSPSLTMSKRLPDVGFSVIVGCGIKEMV